MQRTTILRLVSRYFIALVSVVSFAAAQPHGSAIDIFNFLEDPQDVWLTYVDDRNWVRNAAALPFLRMYTGTFEPHGFAMEFVDAGTAPDFDNGRWFFNTRQNTTTRIILHGDDVATVIREQEWGEKVYSPGLMLLIAGGSPGTVTVQDSRGDVTTFPAPLGGRTSMLQVASGPGILTAGGRSYQIWLGSVDNFAFFVDGVWYGPSSSAPIVPLEPFDPAKSIAGARVVNMLSEPHSYSLTVNGALVSSGQIDAEAATTSFPIPTGSSRVELRIDDARVFDTTITLGPNNTLSASVGRTSAGIEAWASVASRLPTNNPKARLRVVGTGSATDSLYATIVRSAEENATGAIGTAASTYRELAAGNVLVEVGRIGGDMLARAVVTVEPGMSSSIIPTFRDGEWTLRRIDDTDTLAQDLSAARSVPTDSARSIVRIVNVGGTAGPTVFTLANEISASIDTTFALDADAASAALTGSTGSLVLRAQQEAAPAPSSLVTQLVPDFRTTIFLRPSAAGPILERFFWYGPNAAPLEDSARIRFQSLLDSELPLGVPLTTAAGIEPLRSDRGRQFPYVTVPAGVATLRVVTNGRSAPLLHSDIELAAGSVTTIVAVGSTADDVRFFILREEPGAGGDALSVLSSTAGVTDEPTPRHELLRIGDRIEPAGGAIDGVMLEAFDVRGERVATGATVSVHDLDSSWALVVARDRTGRIVGTWRSGE